MTLDTLVTLVLVLGAGIAGFFIRQFTDSYASEKGKNIATKQVIGEITQEIENVKTAIQTIARLRTDYEQQRSEWLLTFYDSAAQILYDKFAVNFGDFPFDEARGTQPSARCKQRR